MEPTTQPRPLPRPVRTAVLVGLALALTFPFAPVATANHGGWAPASSATIHPGVQTSTGGQGCTANFVFRGSDGAVYLGQAAHCASTGGATDTNGCEAGSMPLGTTVRFAGTEGTLAYSSWLTMKQRNEQDRYACALNDFALVRVKSSDHGKVNPSIPFWGGPNGFADGASFGELTYGYGNSALRLGITALSPKVGVSLGPWAEGWSYDVYTVSPGIPGDSGSAILDSNGGALGVLVTLQTYPTGSNGITDVAKALAYLNANTSLKVSLVSGTEPF